MSYVDLFCYVKLSELSAELHLATRLAGASLLCFYCNQFSLLGVSGRTAGCTHALVTGLCFHFTFY